MTLTLPYNFTPRDYQLDQYDALDSGILRVVKCWHRRAGKDLTDWNYLIKRAVQDAGAYWYVLPTLKQGRKAIWEGYTKDGQRYLSFIPDQLVVGKPNNQEMMIKIHSMGGNESIIRIVDALPDKNVGAGVKGVVFSEYSLMRPSIWQYIEPMLMENGGWAIFNGTPRGENHFYEMLKMAENNPRWFAQIVTIDQTGIITEEQINHLREEGRPEEIIQQEYYCSFEGSISGAYYAREMAQAKKDGRITSVHYDPNYLVNTAWDIGIGDSTAIWFYQEVDGMYHIIDYEEHSGYGLPKYAEILAQKGYSYGLHIAPHDGKIRDSWATSFKPETRLAEAKKLGINFTIAPDVGVDDGINAARMLIPKCKFDMNKCSDGIYCLKQYRREFDEGRNVFKLKPVHDDTSHGADAFRYLALGHKKTQRKTVDYHALYS